MAKAAAGVLSRIDYTSDDQELSDDSLDRVLISGPLDERLFWRRKLIEALVDAIAFSQTNKQCYYRHYLLVRELRGLQSAQRDLREFWGRSSRNLQYQIDHIVSLMGDLEADGFDLTRAWYLQEPGGDGVRPASFAQRLRYAIPRADPAEKATLGFSYAPGYGSLSGEVHFQGASSSIPWTVEEFEHAGDTVLLTAMRIVRRVQDLTKSEGGPQASRLSGLLDENPYPAAIASHVTSGRATVGQLVLAYGYLGEVVEIARSEYGYESYLVRYVGKPPLTGITEDWHVAQHVYFLADLDYLAELMLSAPGLDPAQREKIAWWQPRSEGSW